LVKILKFDDDDDDDGDDNFHSLYIYLYLLLNRTRSTDMHTGYIHKTGHRTEMIKN